MKSAILDRDAGGDEYMNGIELTVGLLCVLVGVLIGEAFITRKRLAKLEEPKR